MRKRVLNIKFNPIQVKDFLLSQNSFTQLESDFFIFKNKIMELEIWKDIQGYEGYYQISNLSKIKSLRNNRLLNIFKGSLGYMQITLSKEGKYKVHLVHRLLAIAFIPNFENKPQINHIDGVRFNNSLSNLEWCSCSENALHAHRIGLHKRPNGMNAPNRKLDIKDVELIRENYKNKKFNQRELSEIFNVCNGHISDIINYKRWA